MFTYLTHLFIITILILLGSGLSLILGGPVFPTLLIVFSSLSIVCGTTYCVYKLGENIINLVRRLK